MHRMDPFTLMLKNLSKQKKLFILIYNKLIYNLNKFVYGILEPTSVNNEELLKEGEGELT